MTHEPINEVDLQRIALVIPAFNEAGTVGEVVRQARCIYPHVIVVDDGSHDNTAREAKAAGATVLRHLINRGQGAALKTGIEYALSGHAEVIVTFDSDGQHRLDDVAKLAAPILCGEFDVVLGSRFLTDDTRVPPLRKLTLKLGVVFTRLVSRVNVTDTHNGLRAFSRMAAQQIQIFQDRMAHASEILDEIGRLKLRYREMPVEIRYTEYSRQKGQHSSAAFRIVWDFLIGKWR
jgi:glycosyltransferase involved in cell wall biosynthesis